MRWWKCGSLTSVLRSGGLRLSHSTLHAFCLPASVPCSLLALAPPPRQFCSWATLVGCAKMVLTPQIPKESDQKQKPVWEVSKGPTLQRTCSQIFALCLLALDLHGHGL